MERPEHFDTSGQTLLCEARIAAQNAYARYSGIKVGTALLAASGIIYRGCNVENSSFGLTVCAERVAVYLAVSTGDRGPFQALALVGCKQDNEIPFFIPCGACLQVLSEFVDDPSKFRIYTRGQSLEVTTYVLSDLLPHSFSLQP